MKNNIVEATEKRNRLFYTSMLFSGVSSLEDLPEEDEDLGYGFVRRGRRSILEGLTK